MVGGYARRLVGLRLLAMAALLVALPWLGGCGSGTTVANYIPPQGSYSGPTFSVKVKAGSSAIVSSSVQLYETGTTGNGSAPSALLTAALTSDSTGSMPVPAGYECLTAGTNVYLVARGGEVAGAANNAGIVLLGALGPCQNLTSGAAFVVNEVTTVAGSYALAQFLSAGGAVGATSTNTVGLTNAFATAASLANPATGTAPGATFPANGTAPAARINSLANLLNTCTTSSAACSNLFAAAPGSPSNTLDAVTNIVHAPGTNVAAIFTQSKAGSAFSPALTSAPADWTLFLAFSGGGMNGPSGLGIDSKGDVRVANYFNVASAFSPIGAALFPSGITVGGLNNSYGLAVDTSDNAWIPNEQPYTSSGIGSVSVLNSAGQSVAGSSGYIAGGLDFPIATAVDPNGTVWVVDYGNSHVTLLNASGQSLSGTSGYSYASIQFPVAVAVDGNHFGWLASQSSNTVTKVAPDGSSFTSFVCQSGPSGVAVDQSNNVWVANYFGNSVCLVSSAGTVVSPGYTASATIQHPQGIAIDGSGNVWVANFRAAYLTELTGATAPSPGQALSPAAGWAPDSGLTEAYALAIDASGNIWVTNFYASTLEEYVGLAAPVKTPLSGIPKAP